jgi:proton glutamate symport protein
MTAGTATARTGKADVRGWIAAGTAVYVAAALAQHFWQGSHAVPMIARLAAIALLALTAARRRSLTGWIFWAMLAGIELGLDAPHAAIACRVFSDIFLRLIRVIVAPLILGTLVTGRTPGPEVAHLL